MIASYIGSTDGIKSPGPFTIREELNILSEHEKAKIKHISPLTFHELLKKSGANHQKRAVKQQESVKQKRIHKIDDKSKAISKNKNGTSAISHIFSPPSVSPENLSEDDEDDLNVAWRKLFQDNSSYKQSKTRKKRLPNKSNKQPQSPVVAPIEKVSSQILELDEGVDDAECVDIDINIESTEVNLDVEVQHFNQNRKIKQSESINVTELRRPSRTKNSRPPPAESRSTISAGKRTRNMSKNDYNFTQTDAVPIGGKPNASRAYHTNAIETNTGADSAYRQQLQEVAASMGSLCNIGNSCYMNSVIYTLRYTPLFLHNLHHLVSDFAQIFNQKENQQKMKSASLGRNVNGLQGSNARSYSSKDLVSLGSSSSSTVSLPTLEIVKTAQQKASEKLHELFQCLSKNENEDTNEPYQQSDIFLKAIQDVNPIFEGNQQQDAHEFLMCILDSIRETCQSLKKNVIEHPEIIMQRYNSAVDQVDRQIVKPVPSPPQPIAEKKSGGIWFGKKRKDDKSKSVRVDSPSKDLRNSSESASNVASVVVANARTQSIVNGVAPTEQSPTSAETVLDKIRELGIDFFSEDFEGCTLASTLCLSCESTTTQEEIMLDLSVPITENMEAQQLDETFIQNLCITRERFQGDNKFRCEKCTGYTEAIRQISYPKLPRLLVIQLKRFSGGMEKINSYIPTPFTLQCFCQECFSKRDGPKDHEYKLYSVITHVGATMCAGHYIAYTCSLNLNSCYQNCPKEAYKSAQAAAAAAAAAASAAAITSNINAASGSTASGKDSKSSNASSISSNPVTGVVKKLAGLGRSKNSNADAIKNQKNCNGIKGITNGVDSIHLGNNASTSTPAAAISGAAGNAAGMATTPCPSINCCSIKMKTMPKATNSTTLNGNNNGIAMCNGDYSNHSRNGSLSSVYSEHDQFGQVNGGAAVPINSNSANVNAEPIWFMCDDDKIKAMQQHEFCEMLSPNKKNMITPYLLFYARGDVYQSTH